MEICPSYFVGLDVDEELNNEKRKRGALNEK
jgi:hypothetical protein